MKRLVSACCPGAAPLDRDFGSNPETNSKTRRLSPRAAVRTGQSMAYTVDAGEGGSACGGVP